MTKFEGSFTDEAPFVEKVAAEPEAFVALYDLYFPRVYNFVRYRCDDLHACDDLTSVIFERALAKIATYDARRAPFGAWLFAIARNEVNGYLRTQKYYQSIEEHPDRPTYEPSLEEAYIAAENQTVLLEAIRCLDERERDLLSLKFAAHLTNRRIAEVMGLTESNIGVILYRSVQKLRSALRDKLSL